MKRKILSIISQKDLERKKEEQEEQKRQTKYSKPEADLLSIVFTLVGGAANVTTAFFNQIKTNLARESEHTKEIEPQLKEYVDNVIPKLNEAYPMLDTSQMDYKNITAILGDTYNNKASITTTTFIHSGDNLIPIRHTKPAPGWEQFFEDYKSGKLHYITSDLEDMKSDFDHYTFFDSLKDTLPIGIVSAAIATAILFGPFLYNACKLRKINKDLAKMEKQFRTQPSEKDNSNEEDEEFKL